MTVQRDKKYKIKKKTLGKGVLDCFMLEKQTKVVFFVVVVFSTTCFFGKS